MKTFSPSRLSRSALIAWMICGVLCLVSLANLIALIRSFPTDQNLLRRINAVGITLYPIVFAMVSALITSYQPHNRIAWLLLGPAIGYGVISPIGIHLGSFPTAPPATFINLFSTWLTNWSWLLLIFPLFLILWLFPTGSPPSPRWRWVLYAALGMFTFFLLLATFTRNFHESNDLWTLPNPIGILPDSKELFTYILTPWIISLGILIITSAASLFVRYRHAGLAERQQIKWLLFVSATFAIFFVPLLVYQGNLPSSISDLSDLFLTVSTALFPVAIAVAILRYHLWDIDVIIRRTLQYALLTGLLALVYFGGVILTQLLLGLLGRANSSLTVVLSTLAIAALFTPLRRGVQGFIDRRFFRQHYDGQRTVEAFLLQARRQTDLDLLSDDLVQVIRSALQPDSISLWLKNSQLRQK